MDAHMLPPLTNIHIVEPHYKLLFLSWFGQKSANKIVKFFKKNDYFDILPLNRREFLKKAISAGFRNTNEITNELLFFYLNKEKKINIPKKLSNFLYKIIKPIIPTIGYLLK
jgi:hypothetical protein